MTQPILLNLAPLMRAIELDFNDRLKSANMLMYRTKIAKDLESIRGYKNESVSPDFHRDFQLFGRIFEWELCHFFPVLNIILNQQYNSYFFCNLNCPITSQFHNTKIPTTEIFSCFLSLIVL